MANQDQKNPELKITRVFDEELEVTVTFEDLGDQTRMTLRHAGMRDAGTNRDWMERILR